MLSIVSFFVVFLSFVLFPHESEGCLEKITVESIELDTGSEDITSDFNRFVGEYYFWGFDDITGYPRYVQPSTLGEFSLGYFNSSSGNGGNPYLAMTFTGTYIFVHDNDLSDGEDESRFFNSLTWYSVAHRDIRKETDHLFYIDNGFFNYETENEYDLFLAQDYYPIQLRAHGDLCDGVGFVYAPEENEEPEEREQCPNYDYTVYSSCNDDINCANCQHWGCAKCNDGYYKMGNFMKCQSCSENYGNNCALCGDWNGCIECNYGYELRWSADCNDETCQLQ